MCATLSRSLPSITNASPTNITDMGFSLLKIANSPEYDGVNYINRPLWSQRFYGTSKNMPNDCGSLEHRKPDLYGDD